jgi:KipI family sensor histidine kinase inhibitor
MGLRVENAGRVRRVGDRALLVDLGGAAGGSGETSAVLRRVLELSTALRAAPVAGQVDVVAAAATVLLVLDSARAAARAQGPLADRLRDETSADSVRASAAAEGPSDSQRTREVVLDVVYTGPDLAAAAELLGLSSEALITAHTAETWIAAFGGFAPGFAYCVPERFLTGSGSAGPVWDVPRRPSPRTAVPPGSVGLAGHFSAAYPRSSPGGWQLIGHTNAPLWDEARRTGAGGDHGGPALIVPGDRVRYRAVPERIEPVAGGTGTEDAGPPSVEPVEPGADQADPVPHAHPVLAVLDAGLLTLFQDAGRPGRGDMGVTTSGAADRGAAWRANDLVGNAGGARSLRPAGAVVLENIGGLRLRALDDCVVAITGARAELTLQRTAAAPPHRAALDAPLLLRTGEELTLSAATHGLRSYLAVRGGFAAPASLGSAASDVLSGLGPAPVRAGAELNALSGEACGPVLSVVGSVDPLGSVMGIAGTDEAGDQTTVLRCVAGPRADWFAAGELARFARTRWRVTQQSNRIGLRLETDGTAPETTAAGPIRRRPDNGELASEGMVAGSIQVPPAGAPVVFLADHPVTGGYPVIATLVAADLDPAAQVPPGAPVRFALVDPDTLQPIPEGRP